MFVLGSTEFGAQRARVGVELVCCPSPSPVRGHLPLSGPLPVAGETKGWETRSCLIGPSGRPLEQSHPDPGVSPRSRGVTQILGSHLDPPSLRRLGEVRAGCTRRCVVVEPDPQRAGDLTGLHDGVWGSSAPFPPRSAELTPLGCLDQPGILTSAVTGELDAPRSTWPGPQHPARLRPDVTEVSSRAEGWGAFGGTVQQAGAAAFLGRLEGPRGWQTDPASSTALAPGLQ